MSVNSALSVMCHSIDLLVAWCYYNVAEDCSCSCTCTSTCLESTCCSLCQPAADEVAAAGNGNLLGLLEVLLHSRFTVVMLQIQFSFRISFLKHIQ